MLSVYLYDYPLNSADVVPQDKKLIRDVEKYFRMVNFSDTEINRLIVEELEEGKLISRYAFIDRFGYIIPIEFLSTGCKAALMVHNSDYVIDLLECGRNAINVIFNRCDGSVALRKPGSWYGPYDGPAEKEFQIDGRVCVGIADARRIIMYGD